MRNDFAVFIATHGRAENQLTLASLLAAGYSGKWFLVVDDLDDQKERYKELYGEHVVIFDKMAYWQKTDSLMNKPYLSAILYARKAIEDIAKEKGIQYLLELDDDFTGFLWRYGFSGKLATKRVENNMDKIIELYVGYLESAKIACLAFGSAPSYIGGLPTFQKEPKRRCFGSFFRNVEIPVDWISVMNEDYITSVNEGVRGGLFMEISDIQIETKGTASGTDGGMQLTYNAMNTYVRGFFAVIAQPSMFRVERKSSGEFCIAQRGKGLPKVVSERWKK